MLKYNIFLKLAIYKSNFTFEILYFSSLRTAKNSNSDLSKREVNRKPQGKAFGEYFDSNEFY